MKTPTIYAIKYLITNESHYFDRKSMRFFGQTLKDFCVKKSPTGRIFIYAPIKDSYTKKFTGSFSIREFADNKLIHCPIMGHISLSSIINFINDN
jgi:hypothetical protein